MGGDVVDFTTKEVIQSKDLTTKSETTLWNEINLGVRQSMGERGEYPPTDSRGREFAKIIEVRIDETQSGALSKLNSKTLLGKLNERIQLHGQLKGFDGLVRIRIGDKVMEFRIRSGNPGTVQCLN